MEAKNMMKKIYDFVEANEDIRILSMEGSRINPNIADDDFKDYDISFFTEDTRKYIEDEKWIDTFGEICMMQKPDDMELFPIGDYGYSYLTLFKNGERVDFSIYEMEDLASYLGEDSLRKILIDKDGKLQVGREASDLDYHIKKPTYRSYLDSLNEFWHLLTYVLKGLYRGELLYSIDHLQILRDEMLRMISWNIGEAYGYDFSLGKNYKFIDKYISAELMEDILSTYRTDTYDYIWSSLYKVIDIYRSQSLDYGKARDFAYPNYDENVSSYMESMNKKYKRD